MSLSKTEVEYVIVIGAACQETWMRRMLRDLHHDQEVATTIFYDNTSVITLSKNYVFHKRTKHIDDKYHFIRELTNNDEIVLQHCRSQGNFFNILIKPLASESFVYLRKYLRIVDGGNCD